MIGNIVAGVALLAFGSVAGPPVAQMAGAHPNPSAAPVGAADTVHVAPPTGEQVVDRASILAALAQTGPGDVIQFAPGTYVVGEIIPIETAHLTILGHGDGTTLRGCDPGDYLRMGTDVGAAGDDQWARMTALLTCGMFEMTGGHGTIRGLTFEYTAIGLVLGAGHSDSIDFHRRPGRVTDGGYLVENNVFRNSANGVRPGYLSSAPTVVRGNRFMNLGHALSGSGAEIHVFDNDISVADPDPLVLPTGPLFAIGISGAQQSVFEGNRIEGHPVGIALFGSSHRATRHNVIRDNTVHGVSFPLVLWGEEGVNGIVIEDNLIERNRITGAVGVGIALNLASNNRILDNTMSGIEVRDSSLAVPFDLGEGNGSGIWVSPGSDENEILGNTFDDITSHALVLAGDRNHVELQGADDKVRDLGSDNRVQRPDGQTGSDAPPPYQSRFEVPFGVPGDALAHEFGACAGDLLGGYGIGPVRSLHVPMRDGVRIALDVVLPEGMAEGEKVPTLLVMTRHWRAVEDAEAHPVQRSFTPHGYAVVHGDVRGTGASFGVWPHHRSRDETLDFGEIIDWIAAQPWSDGRVAGGGVAYSANTADWMVERGRSTFHAALSKFPDYDPYVDLYFPGGVPNVYMGRTMGHEVKELDLNTPRELAAGRRVGVRPVDADTDGALVREAVEARREVPSVWEGLEQITFKDDAPDGWGGWSMDDWGIHARQDAVEAAGTPIYSWGSWMNAGTANGVLRRFMTLSNPQRVVVGPWSQGAREDADPYRPVDAPVEPTPGVQALEDLCWLEQWVRGRDVGMADRLLVYYTMGEERWKTTPEWPLPSTVYQDWFFRAGGLLVTEAPTEPDVADAYEIDFEATTGTRNRWATNNDGGDVVYPDRAKAGERLLVFDSAPLPKDLEITGQPVATLHVTSTHNDGAFFVYLEDVDPDGRVRYVTEGMLRAIHRKVSDEAPPYRTLGPYHSFRRADARPLVPGEPAELTFEMMPTSALIRAGHRIRIAIAGADADTFQRVPETGSPVIEVHRSAVLPSHVRLPVVPRP